MVRTIGIIFGTLALSAAFLILSMGLTSLHTSIDELHGQIFDNQALAQKQHKSTKDLSHVVKQDTAKLHALAKKVMEDEQSAHKQASEIQNLRGDFKKRMNELSNVVDSGLDIKKLHEALVEEKRKNDQSAAKMAQMQEQIMKLMTESFDSAQTQHALEAALNKLTLTVASMNGHGSTKLSSESSEVAGVEGSDAQAKGTKSDSKDRKGSASTTVEDAEAKGTKSVSEDSNHEEKHPGSTTDAHAEAKGSNGDSTDSNDEVKDPATAAVADAEAKGSKSDSQESDDEAQNSANPKGDVSAGEEDGGDEDMDKDSGIALGAEEPGDDKIGDVATEAQAIWKPGVVGYRVSWYRECGCTGMEIEAVTLLAGLAAKIGRDRIHTNRCRNSCQWPQATLDLLQSIEIPHERDLWPREPLPAGVAHILVIHAAFAGVCGVPSGLNLPPHRDTENAAGLFRVSRSMMETDRLSKHAASMCNDLFDQVWVPADFNVQTFSEASVEKSLLHVLPEAVDTDFFKCKITEPTEGETPFNFGVLKLDEFMEEGRKKPMTFTFLSVFKWEPRKNWRMLLEAFWSAFPTDQTSMELPGGHRIDVTARLLIKTTQLSYGTDVRVDLAAFLKSKGMTWDQAMERLLVVTTELATEAMPELYRAADAFVLPSHGEGWGLPIIEALSSGLPTIATSWGGQSAFMTRDNSWPLGYTMQYAAGYGDKWAMPDEAEFQEALLEVAKRTPESATRAERACKDIRQNFNPGRIAASADELFSSLSGTKTA